MLLVRPGEALAVDAGATVPAFMVSGPVAFVILPRPLARPSRLPPTVGLETPAERRSAAPLGLRVRRGHGRFCGAVLVFVAGEDRRDRLRYPSLAVRRPSPRCGVYSTGARPSMRRRGL